MAFAGVMGAAFRRPDIDQWPDRLSGPIVRRIRHRTLPAARSSVFPEIDCVRHLLPPGVIAAAERRARALGLGADRVLICADSITEEAYLTALAASLGTSYDLLEGISRSACPLDDNQLIQAATVGLLPLRERGGIIWIIAPRGPAARRLADPRQSRPRWLRGFRLTSSERLWRFIARHSQKTLGQRAAGGLRRSRPLLSNAPRPSGWRRIAIVVFVAIAATILALIPAAAVKAFGTLLCAIFLAAAGLRLSSAFYTRHAPAQPARIDDGKLPVYTIICPLYQEANVVGKLVAAIRGLDYPGIMAQTPQAA